MGTRLEASLILPVALREGHATMTALKTAGVDVAPLCHLISLRAVMRTKEQVKPDARRGAGSLPRGLAGALARSLQTLWDGHQEA